MGTLVSPSPAKSARRRVIASGLLGALILAAVLILPPLFSWQRNSEQSTLSLSNIRRLAIGALVYSQDWDGRFMPLARQETNGTWTTWPQLLRPYVSPESVFRNPANPVLGRSGPYRDPTHGYPISTGYAFNRRFWNTFSSGPYPLEDLEIAGQTALIVEAGPAWRDPTHRSPDNTIALQEYGDTEDRVQGLCPYPSPHSGQIVVAAADGHAILLKVEHYNPTNGPHDRLYGRIGTDLYNWNGGHPNGLVDRASHE